MKPSARTRRLARAVGALMLLAVASVAAAQDFRVSLLGTGSPNPAADRFGMSTLVEAGPERLLFDAGRGSTIRLWQLRVPIGSVTATFISHFHSDHTVGIPDLWLTGWIQRPYGGRTTPFVIYGPKGMVATMAALQVAYAEDVRIRTIDEKAPPAGAAVEAHDHEAGVIYERNGVRVTAITVDHGADIKPSFGWRIDYGGRSVVISGDTRYSPHLAELAKGADLLIHEVSATTSDVLADSPVAQSIFAHHTTPQQAGRVFDQARPRLAVYSHLVLIGDAKRPPPGLDEVVRQTRETYAGPLVVGQDLMRFDVLADEVRVVPPSTADR